MSGIHSPILKLADIFVGDSPKPSFRQMRESEAKSPLQNIFADPFPADHMPLMLASGW